MRREKPLVLEVNPRDLNTLPAGLLYLAADLHIMWPEGAEILRRAGAELEAASGSTEDQRPNPGNLEWHEALYAQRSH